MRTFLTRRSWIFPLLFLVVLLILPGAGMGVRTSQQVILIVVYALIVSGLNLSWGYAGELALGQVPFFAAGAYATAITRMHGHADLLLALAVSLATAGLLGFITGLPAFRLKGWPLALSSFFLVLLIPNILMIFEGQTRGLRGIVGVVGPTLFGQRIGRADYYSVVIVVAAVWFAVLRNLVRSRYGTALRLMKQSNQLAESLGVNVTALRFSTYVVAALPAGMAGTLFAYYLGVVVPTSFTLTLLVTFVAASVVGGSRSVWGALVGALLLVAGQQATANFEQYSLIAYGIFLILVGTVFKGGLAGLANRLLRRVSVAGSHATVESPGELTAIPGRRLVAQDVRKTFGGLQALRGAELVAEPGQITALIGANGAGKTTLLNSISGFVVPDRGSITLDGVELVGRRGSRVARAGVGRTFQTPQIPEGFTAAEVVASGRFRVGRLRPVAAILRLKVYRRQHRQDARAAAAALRFAGLEAISDSQATSLPLGTRRLLEVVRCVAGSPGVLLLDEPAAGLDDDALVALKALLLRARDAGATIVLVEHNVPFVLDISDRVWVMDLGRPLVDGTPEQVRTDPAVIATYLGRRRGLDADAAGITVE
ncbi:ABC transporter permease subunit [Amycolatopsis acidicola]|nr:ATP-binding cassette domain-containing protein [Amycolatopsis acidicola]